MKLYNNSSRPFSLYLSLILVLLSVSWPWLQLQALVSGSKNDHLALLKFKQGITTDPHNIFSFWNDSLPFCSWSGVTCSRRHQRVSALILNDSNLIGSISPYIGNLSFLRILDLQNNNFHGHIPQQVGNLFRLKQFLVRNNSLAGQIPSSLSHCRQLKIIDLTYNRVQGRIPPEIGSLAKLEILFLGVNNLGGEIPPSLANLSSLTSFSVSRNTLVGSIPADIGRLRSLTFFSVAGNNLSGLIPPSLYNISSIFFISTAANQLNGSIPETIGLSLPNLQEFHIGGNEFSGSIPNSLSNASGLKSLALSANKFEGQVPNLGNHPKLVLLDLSQNNLGTNFSSDLMFLSSLKNCTNLEVLDIGYNNFGGAIPNSVANLSVSLNSLYFGGNQFIGIIPAGLENLINLIDLGMESNLFTGVIPSYFGKFQKLQGLLLWRNSLSGQIPSSLGNLTGLSKLILSQNRLTGSIPSSIANCTSLNFLTVSRNQLQGPIPQELTGLPALSILLSLAYNSLTGNLPAQVGKLKNIYNLDVSENKLSGEIPTSIGDCSGLVKLYMQGNSFQGAIPSSLASLRGVEQLDISRNNLTGEIPKDLQNLPFLQYLNLSFNDLEGEVPTKGVFGNETALSLFGNAKLCGGMPQLLLPKCPPKLVKKGKSHALKIAIIITCVLLAVLFFSAFLLSYKRNKSTRRSSAEPSLNDMYVKVSYQDLHHATSGFSSANLIGSGSFGSVYKGYLEQIERPIAIKVLKLERHDAFKSLKAECKVLKNVRHRNLIKLLSYCSSLDYKGNDFKALIFEFMENGSLDGWLHHDNDGNNQQRSLNFFQRLNIAIDVASALHYLHELTESPIIHCDLKPSNVLLDEDMVAHVSDFGLARHLLNTNDVSQSQTSSIGINGTVGYAPPEYAMGSPASKEGDVYSYGIFVLEMFSGKRPTDKMFKDSLNLHNFVKNALPERLAQIVDQTLIYREMEETPIPIGKTEDNSREIQAAEEKEETNNRRNLSANGEKCLVSVLQVGVGCSRESPKDRMKAGDAAKELHFVKSCFLRSRIYEY